MLLVVVVVLVAVVLVVEVLAVAGGGVVVGGGGGERICTSWFQHPAKVTAMGEGSLTICLFFQFDNEIWDEYWTCGIEVPRPPGLSRLFVLLLFNQLLFL